MKIVALIPAYNEEGTITTVIEQALRLVSSVVVVDDGSKDQTAKLAKDAGAIVISHSINMGVGESFKTGLRAALDMDADILVTLDGDNQFYIEDLPRIISPIIEGKADFVTGSRFMEGDGDAKMTHMKKFGNRIFTNLVSRMVGKEFTDTQCGFRAYSKESLLRMTLFGRFTYTQEVFLNLANSNLRIVEVPIKVRPRETGESKVVKNPFHYGFKAIKIILLAERDHHPLRFFGTISGVFFLLGILSLTFVFINWLVIGMTSPYTSLITVGGFSIIIGAILLVIALMADMLGRHRQIQEEVLYLLRKNRGK